MVIDRSADNLEHALFPILARGGVVIMPCDTIYGMVGLAPNTDARIRQMKGRNEGKPFLELIPDISWLTRFTPARLPAALARHWPGPLTVVFPRTPGGTVALRVPADPLLRALLLRLDGPLFSTSVNPAGEPFLFRIAEIRERFEHTADAIVDGGDLPLNAPSTIVDIATRPFSVIRQGILNLTPKELDPEGPSILL